MKNITQALKVVTLAIILSFGISYVYAWTAPTQRPPSGNVSAPINTSATEQYKEGTLGIGGLIRGYANAIFDGNVGIGTTAPNTLLSLYSNYNGGAIAPIHVQSSGKESGISFGKSINGNQLFSIKIGSGSTNRSDFTVVDETAGALNSLTIQSGTGNVGIGVSTPSEKLDVAGNIKGTGLCIGTDCKTAWPASGGTTPPAGSEFLNTSATAQTKAGWLKAVGGNGGDPASRIGVGNNWWMSENTNGNYAIHRNGVGDKLTMDTSGNVGIGTTAPQKKLEIKGDHSSTQARLFSDHYGQGINGANTAVMSLWASEPGWTWGGVGIGNNINGSPYYGRVTNTRGGSYLRLLDNSISLHTLNSSGTDTGGLDVTNGNVTATSLNTGGAVTAGTVTASGNIQGQHIKFPGVGGNSGAGADVYSIYQESGPWSYPYPDLRIQYHTGIKYDAYQGYGGHQFYTGWDGSGNPAGLQMQITDKVYVSNDVCTTAGKCLSTTGGVASIDYGNCVTITHSYGLAGLSCGGVTVQANSGDCTPYTNYVMVSDSTGLRFPGVCVAAVAKCCKLK